DLPSFLLVAGLNFTLICYYSQCRLNSQNKIKMRLLRKCTSSQSFQSRAHNQNPSLLSHALSRSFQEKLHHLLTFSPTQCHIRSINNYYKCIPLNSSFLHFPSAAMSQPLPLT
ncbi:unnamed protein product, partial [Allacma fusca]